MLRTSSPHVIPTLRRTERSRACAGPSGAALRRARNAMADELIGLWALQPGRPVPADRGDLHRVLSHGLLCLCPQKAYVHMSAERAVLIQRTPGWPGLDH